MLVKVCGLRSSANIKAVASLGVDFLGFIFYPQSPRFVGENFTLPENLPAEGEAMSANVDSLANTRIGVAGEILCEKGESDFPNGNSGDANSTLPANKNSDDICAMSATADKSDAKSGEMFSNESPRPKTVAVFVNEDFERIMGVVKRFGFDYVQLHGSESPELAQRIKDAGFGVIKAMSVASKEDFQACSGFEGIIDYFLFDTKCKCFGGSGAKFDWTMLEYYRGTTPFFLSGGLGPGDAARVLSFTHPAFAGVDLNSRFESAPGLKNTNDLEAFISEIRMSRA